MNEHEQKDEKQWEHSKESSLLFEPVSVGFITVCFVAAIWFQFFPLLLVCTFLLLLAIFILLWKHLSLRRVEPSLSLPVRRVFAGEDFFIDASVKNEKWLPLIWLEWEFPPSENVRWGKKRMKTYTARILSLRWHEKVEWRVCAHAFQRGVYDIGTVILRSGDGFRFSEKEKRFFFDERMYIYPRLVPVRTPSFAMSTRWEVTGRKGGFLEDPLLISGVRDYVSGDEWRRLNAKASARLGKLQTNVYEPIVSKYVSLYVDVQQFVIDEERYKNEPLKRKQYERMKRDRFEKVLQVVASIAITYVERGVKVAFAANGANVYGTHSALVLPTTNVTSVLDELAKLSQRVVNERISVLDELLQKGVRHCPLFIFCERLTNEHIDTYERYHRDFDLRFYYVQKNERLVELENVSDPIDHLAVRHA